MKKFLALFIFISASASAQMISTFGIKDLKYSFDRSDAFANKIDYTTFYVFCYAGTKSGWNAKTKDYYPIQDKIIYSKVFRLTVPVPQIYRPSETGHVADGISKQFLQSLIKTAGFSDELNYATWIGDYDLNFVEKKITETLVAQKNNYTKLKFQYFSKFSFDYSDAFYKVSYKGD